MLHNYHVYSSGEEIYKILLLPSLYIIYYIIIRQVLQAARQLQGEPSGDTSRTGDTLITDIVQYLLCAGCTILQSNRYIYIYILKICQNQNLLISQLVVSDFFLILFFFNIGIFWYIPQCIRSVRLLVAISYTIKKDYRTSAKCDLLDILSVVSLQLMNFRTKKNILIKSDLNLQFTPVYSRLCTSSYQNKTLIIS